jgi:hypothetical protein
LAKVRISSLFVDLITEVHLDEEEPFFFGDEQKDKENINDDKVDRDPDLLVFGFQELDLSAGALIYSVDTTREDAWTDAILAGLGEKAELYVKARVFCQIPHVNLNTSLILAGFETIGWDATDDVR